MLPSALIAHHKGVAIKDLDLLGHREPSAPRITGAVRAAARERSADRVQQLDITGTTPRAAQHRRHRILLTTAQPLEQRPVGLDRALCQAILVRHHGVALVEGHQPSIGTTTIYQVEAHPARDLRQKRLRPAPAKPRRTPPRRRSSPLPLPIPVIGGDQGYTPWPDGPCLFSPSDRAPGYGQTPTSRPWAAIAQMTNTSTAMMSSDQNG